MAGTANSKGKDDQQPAQTETKVAELESLLPQTPAEAAKFAHLRYVNDDEPGYRRKRWGRGFTFLDRHGAHVKDEALRARFAELVIPPAWTEVWICRDRRGHIQATGRDDQGRKQYIYHPRWEEVRQETKFHRLALFGERLPALRRQLDHDLRRHDLPREKVIAIVIRLLEETLVRIGSERYAAENESYGLTTLEQRHLQVSGSTIHMEFNGKRQIEQEVDIRDRRLARNIKRCQTLPGQRLFQYHTDEGDVDTITSTDVNDYLREHMGESFSAKDFRTWGGTICAAQMLLDVTAETEEPPAEKHVVEAIKRTAEALGNTPAVARNYYVHPGILKAYLAGELAPAVAAVDEPREGMTELETAVLGLITEQLQRQAQGT